MRLIRLKEVINLTGLGRSSIYKFMSENKFPQSISLGERAIAWQEGEIEEWLQDKIDHRKQPAIATAKLNQYEINESDVIAFIKAKFARVNMSDAIAWLIKVIG
ncbi:MAG: AlpA family transcriptional regulator [Alteromonadaceae bacterium]|nr:AlpA family transcriptional regulator [Alteromonadaceae bacterium]